MRQVPTSGDRWVWREGRVSIERAEMWKYSPMENAVVELMCTLVCGGRWTVQRWTQGRGWTEVQITWRRWMMMTTTQADGADFLPFLLLLYHYPIYCPPPRPSSSCRVLWSKWPHPRYAHPMPSVPLHHDICPKTLLSRCLIRSHRGWSHLLTSSKQKSPTVLAPHLPIIDKLPNGQRCVTLTVGNFQHAIGWP